MKQFDFDLNDDIYKANPGYWPNIITLQNDNIEQEDLIFEINTQIVQLENLGINYLEQYDNNLISIDLFNKFLDFINDNYINIPFLETIRVDYNKSLVYFRSLYEFLVIDFIIDVLPLINSNRAQIVREIIINHINNKLTQLNNLYIINNNLRPEMIKYSILLDLFNNNIEQFYESYITIVKVKYLNK